MSEWVPILVSLAMVAACAVFVAAEFSLITVDRASVEQSAAAGDRRSRTVLAALRTLSSQLSGAQLGITITNLAIGFLAQPAIADLIRGPLESLGVPPGVVPGISVAIALLVATAVTMVLGELVPKNLAIAEPWRTARAVAGLHRGFTKSTAWLIRVLNGTANATVRALGFEPTEELASARSPEELTALVRRSAEKGALDPATATLITKSLAFGDRTARDVLTPRVRVQAIGSDASVDQLIAVARRTGHSRFPVVGTDGLDDVQGIVHIKNAVAVPRSDRATVSVASVMTAPVFVPDSLQLDPLLETLRSEGLQVAVVVDEYGGAAGIVTIEDLIEEIVGEVADEHDRPQPRTQRLADGSWVVSALLRPDEATELTGLQIPTDDSYETLAGLLADELGRIPAMGDHVTVGRLKMRVVRMDGRRVDRIRLTSRQEDDEATP